MGGAGGGDEGEAGQEGAVIREKKCLLCIELVASWSDKDATVPKNTD